MEEVDQSISFLHLYLCPHQWSAKNLKWSGAFAKGACCRHISFLLVAEAFQVTVLDTCNEGILKCVSLSKGGDNFSILQYAYDALFFGKWSCSNAKNLILILRCFEDASRLKVNLYKSRIFGVGVNIEKVESVATSLGWVHDFIPIAYIGLSVGKRMHFRDGWFDIVNWL
ncbi:hypothetical protein Tco_0414410 [Tanacetum coccineum]